uniref:Uncharacterized protein n=1 Tax=Avena sativa TaxID=4498 RepID=A0ACD5TAU4_AVESA
MYQVIDHVTEGAAPRDSDASWRDVDIHLSLWFMATLTPELHRLVQGADGLAGTTCRRLHRFFLDNQSQRYLYLSKAFRNAPRGDMSIDTYASKLQALADDLDAIGHPVDDHDLALQFVDVLGKRYKLQAEILKTALLSFADCTSRLQLAEVTSDSEDNGAQVYAAHTGNRGPSGGGGGRGGLSRSPGGSSSIPGVSPNYSGNNPIPGFQHGAGQGQGRSSRYTSHQHLGGGQGGHVRGSPSYGGRGGHYGGRGGSHSSQQPWFGYFTPMGALFPPARLPWIPPNPSGVLGPRSGSHTQVYPAMLSGHQPQPSSSTRPPYSFDHNAMLHAAMSNNSSPQQPEWIMDSGATSHVTGPSHQDPSSSLQ